MCKCIQNKIDSLVDEYWPDVQDEILYQIRLKNNQPALVDKGPPPTPCCCIPCRSFKAWFLYTYDPVDRSIWYSLRTFSWWLLIVIESFPYYGVQSVFKLVYFLLMDKGDEYQLVQFILTFKKLQFLTLGCLSSILGYAFYYYCSTFPGQGQPSTSINRCASRGASDPLIYYLEIGGFSLQLLLVYSAYMLIPCSKQKGMPRFGLMTSAHRREVEEREGRRGRGCCGQRGNRLNGFMLWELFTCILSIGIFIALMYALQSADQSISMRSSVFLVKTVYGLLS